MPQLTMNAVFAVVHVARPELRHEVDRRLDALERFYAPLGHGGAPLRRWVEPLGLLLAGIPLGQDAAGAGDHDSLSWGAALPAMLGDPRVLLEARPAQLRELPTPLAAVAWDDHRAVMVAAAGPTSLYASQHPGIRAWSSHAVASAWLATGQARVDPAAIPELLAMEFVGDDRSLILGASAVPSATLVTFGGGEPRESCFWPLAERWAKMPAEEAAIQVEELLTSNLEQRLTGARAPVLGLTAGLDSTTVAVALRELGIPFQAFTFGGDPSELHGARRAAAALTIPHSHADFAWWSDAEGLRRLHEEVRWSEGGAPAGFGEVAWPKPMSHWIVGMGAETGRAFYYAWSGEEEPTTRRAAAVLAARTRHGLVGADAEVLRAHRDRCRRWVEEAAAAGAAGSRGLDLVYGEQRVRRWGRGITGRTDAELVPSFTAPRLMAAMSSLPVNDRLRDQWQRRYVAARVPSLARQPPSRPRVGMLTPWRRQLLVQRLRHLRRAAHLPAPARRATTRWFDTDPWRERPTFPRWLHDDVLHSRLLECAFGDRWLADTRAAFLRGDAGAGRATLWTGAVIALDAALSDLRSD